ncbi:MAG: hypothetical protein ACFCVF_10650 [Kineosporiaceae bacterium]
MPYPEEYDSAAILLEDAAAATRELLRPAQAVMGQGVMVGGQLTQVVTTELESAQVVLDGVSTELAALAETCRLRAAEGRQYLAAEAEFSAANSQYEFDQREWARGLSESETGTAPPPGPEPVPPGPAPAAPSWFG